MLDRADHAAHGGRILERAGRVHLLESEATQRGGLDRRTARGTADLANRDGLLRVGFLLGHVLRSCLSLLALLAFAARDDLCHRTAAALGNHARALLIHEPVENG